MSSGARIGLQTIHNPLHIGRVFFKMDSCLSEFLVFENVQTEPESYVDGKSFMWTRENTLKLLELYKKYRNQVGTLQIRNFKKMWEVISLQFKKLFNVFVSASNCENRWRVLERNYKKYIDNKNQTGAGRKVFEFANEMEEILGKKKNIKPTVVLSTETITTPYKKKHSLDNEEPSSGHDENEELISGNIENEEPSNSAEQIPSPKTFKTPKIQHALPRRKTPKYRSNVLEQIRKDKEERHKERLAFEKEKFEKMFKLEEEKHSARLEKNALLKENNSILKEKNSLLKEILKQRLSVTEILD